MILRFATIGPDGQPRYIAINTDIQAYTQGREAAPRPEPVYISPDAYMYILREMDFCGWDYTDDIRAAPDLDDLLPF